MNLKTEKNIIEKMSACSEEEYKSIIAEIERKRKNEVRNIKRIEMLNNAISAVVRQGCIEEKMLCIKFTNAEGEERNCFISPTELINGDVKLMFVFSGEYAYLNDKLFPVDVYSVSGQTAKSVTEQAVEADKKSKEKMKAQELYEMFHK